MREVSGVTGAGPILHAIFDYLHGNYGTSWYRTPPGIVERTIHPLTGKLLADGDARGVREKFLADHLPPTESPADYDVAGNVQLRAGIHRLVSQRRKQSARPRCSWNGRRRIVDHVAASREHLRGRSRCALEPPHSLDREWKRESGMAKRIPDVSFGGRRRFRAGR